MFSRMVSWSSATKSLMLILELYVSDAGQPLAYGVLDQLGDALNAQLLHQLTAMPFDGLGADVQISCNHLRRSTFRDQLEHFPLSLGQHGVRGSSRIRRMLQIFSDDQRADLGAKISTVRTDVSYAR